MRALLTLVCVSAWSAAAAAQAPTDVPAVPDAYLEAEIGAAPEDGRIRSDWPEPARRRAFLHLVSEDVLTVHLREGSGWREICTTPCDAALLRGPIELAPSHEGSTPTAIEHAVVERDGAWALELDEHWRERGVAVPLGILAAVLVGTAVALFATAGEPNAEGERALAVGMGVVGLVAGVAVCVSIPFTLATPDEARARVRDDDP